MKMDCQDLLARLDAFLDGTLPPAERCAVDAHLRSCADCARWVDSPDATTPDAPEEMTTAILERTSGSTCGSAHARLCDHVDGELQSVDRVLVEAHLDACTGCAELSRALSRMSSELASLAEMEPGSGFAAEVLSRTSDRRAASPSWAARVEAFLEKLLVRPRAAWELAYVGTFVLALVFVVPASPFASVPLKALGITQINPVRELREPVARLEAGVVGGVQSVWATTERKVGVAARGVERRAVSTWDGWRQRVGTFLPGAASEQENQQADPSGKSTEPAQGDES